MCFTRTRSPVRTRQETKLFFPPYSIALTIVMETNLLMKHTGFHGVMVSTLDFESSDPSSNLGGTLLREDHFLYSKNTCKMVILGIKHRQSSSNWTIFNKNFIPKNVWALFCVPHLCHICGTCGTSINVPHFCGTMRIENWGLRIEVCEGWQLRCTEVYEVQSSYKSPQCVVIVVVVVYIWNHHTLWWFDKGSCVYPITLE